MQEQLKSLYASGGGDGPEGVTAGIKAAMELDWRPAAAKMCVLIADAPCHGIGEVRLCSCLCVLSVGERGELTARESTVRRRVPAGRTGRRRPAHPRKADGRSGHSPRASGSPTRALARPRLTDRPLPAARLAVRCRVRARPVRLPVRPRLVPRPDGHHLCAPRPAHDGVAPLARHCRLGARTPRDGAPHPRGRAGRRREDPCGVTDGR